MVAASPSARSRTGPRFRMSRIMGSMQRSWSATAVAAGLISLGLLAAVTAGCGAGSPDATPPITPGTSSAPRELNIVARDFAYAPATVDLVPGETVILHVVNGGLVTHEAILGNLDTQLAWETAESPFANPPPGPTPVVPAPPGFRRRPGGRRVRAADRRRVDGAGQRRDRPERLVRRLPHPRALGEGHGRARPVRGPGRHSARLDANPAGRSHRGLIPGHWSRADVPPVHAGSRSGGVG